MDGTLFKWNQFAIGCRDIQVPDPGVDSLGSEDLSDSRSRRSSLMPASPKGNKYAVLENEGYTIGHTIGRGAVSIIKEGYDKLKQREVAIKVCNVPLSHVLSIIDLRNDGVWAIRIR